MYNLILVLATGVTTVGNYTNLNSCQAELAQFQKQNVTLMSGQHCTAGSEPRHLPTSKGGRTVSYLQYLIHCFHT